jgi:hypothetical protein
LVVITASWRRFVDGSWEDALRLVLNDSREFLTLPPDHC